MKSVEKTLGLGACGAFAFFLLANLGIMGANVTLLLTGLNTC